MQISQRNSSISAYEEQNGQFDYNKMSMPIIGTWRVMYNDDNTRSIFENHGVDYLYVDKAPLHYWVYRCFVTHTRSHCMMQSAKLYPTHCKILTTSEDDITLIVASELLEQMKVNVPSAEWKIRHANIIHRLATIMNNNTPPRVDASAPQRVAQTSSSSNNTTSPRVIEEQDGCINMWLATAHQCQPSWK